MVCTNPNKAELSPGGDAQKVWRQFCAQMQPSFWLVVARRHAETLWCPRAPGPLFRNWRRRSSLTFPIDEPRWQYDSVASTWLPGLDFSVPSFESYLCLCWQLQSSSASSGIAPAHRGPFTSLRFDRFILVLACFAHSCSYPIHDPFGPSTFTSLNPLTRTYVTHPYYPKAQPTTLSFRPSSRLHQQLYYINRPSPATPSPLRDLLPTPTSITTKANTTAWHKLTATLPKQTLLENTTYIQAINQQHYPRPWTRQRQASPPPAPAPEPTRLPPPAPPLPTPEAAATTRSPQPRPPRPATATAPVAAPARRDNAVALTAR